MLFKLYTKLMYPEPEATGSETETQTEEKKEANGDTAQDPFLDALDESEESSEEGDDLGHGDDVSETDDFDWEGIQYEEDDKKLITELAEKHKLSKRALSPFLRDVQTAVAEADKKNAEAARNKANEDLRKKWGANYDTNVKKVGGFIRNLGKSVGWGEDVIKSFSNAQSFALFHDIMRYTGESKLRGATVTVAQDNYPKTLEACRAELHSVEESWFAAKKDGNHTKMKEMSDRHVELLTIQKKFMGTYNGKPAPRLFKY